MGRSVGLRKRESWGGGGVREGGETDRQTDRQAGRQKAILNFCNILPIFGIYPQPWGGDSSVVRAQDS